MIRRSSKRNLPPGDTSTDNLNQTTEQANITPPSTLRRRSSRLAKEAPEHTPASDTAAKKKPQKPPAKKQKLSASSSAAASSSSAVNSSKATAKHTKQQTTASSSSSAKGKAKMSAKDEKGKAAQEQPPAETSADDESAQDSPDDEHDETDNHEDSEDNHESDNNSASADPLTAMLRQLAADAGIPYAAFAAAQRGMTAQHQQGMATSGRWTGIVERLNSSDMSEQYSAAQELSDLLVVATEETIGPGSGSGFNPRAVLPPLSNIIQSEGSPELAVLACRCIANLLEALPTPTVHAAITSSAVIVGLCQNLLMIEVIDVAEQSLSLLEKLSHEHAAEILKSGGLMAVLAFIDFFSISTQRVAAQCAANLTIAITREHNDMISDVPAILARLLQSNDPRTVDAAALALGRIVETVVNIDNVRRSSINLSGPIYSSQKKASSSLDTLVTKSIVDNALDLIEKSAALSGLNSLNPVTVLQLLKLLRNSIAHSSSLAEHLLASDIASYVCLLVTGTKTVGDAINISEHTVEQWREILDFVVLMFPETNTDSKIQYGDKLFSQWSLESADAWAKKTRDDVGSFPLNTQQAMVKNASLDAKLRSKLVDHCTVIVPLLLEVFQSSANSSIRSRCLVSLLRICEFLDNTELTEIMRQVPFANFMSLVFGRSYSQLKADAVAVEAQNVALVQTTYSLAICKVLRNKVPDTYDVIFRREGVVHEVVRLSELFADVAHEETCKEIIKFRAAINQIVEDTAEDYEARALKRADVTTKCQDHNKLVSVWFRQHLGAEIKVFLDGYVYFLTIDLIHSFDGTKDAAVNLFARFQELCTSEKAEDMTCLVSLLQSITDKDSSQELTPFELHHDGWVTGICNWMSGQSKSTQITQGELASMRQQVILEYLKNHGYTFLENLVRKLQQCVGRLEPFGLVRPLGNIARTEGNSTEYGFLNRQIRIRLVPHPDVIDTAKAFRANSSASDTDNNSASDTDREEGLLVETMVAMQSVATFESLQKFLMQRLQSYFYHVEAAEASDEALRAAQIAEEETSSSEDEDEFEVGSTFSSISGQRRRENSGTVRVRHDSSFVETIGGEPVAGANSPHVHTPKPWKIQFTIDSMNIPHDSTIYGAAHRFEWENIGAVAAGLESKRPSVVTSAFRFMPTAVSTSTDIDVFSSCYTVRYRPIRRGREHDTGTVSPKKYQEHVPAFNIPFQDCTNYMFDYSSLPASIRNMPDQSFGHALSLLKILHKINGSLSSESRVPDSLFVNNKLASNVMRQLSDKLITAGGVVPSWCHDLCSYYCFIIPLESRVNFLNYTGFGLTRTLMRMIQDSPNEGPLSRSNSRPGGNQNTYDPRETLAQMARLSRQKVRIHRSQIFPSALKVMDAYADRERYQLEIEFFDEVGTGLGPTLEFYALVSEHWQRRDLEMWRDDGLTVAHVKGPLFPRPCHPNTSIDIVCQQFKTLGKFVAKALNDHRIVDIPFSPYFLQLAVFGRQEDLSLAEKLSLLGQVDESLAESLSKLLLMVPGEGDGADEKLATSVAGLSLDYTLPGYASISLENNGVDKNVTSQNLSDYIQLVIDMSLNECVSRQVRAFRDGFSSVVPISRLQVFSSSELAAMWSSGRWEGLWTREELYDILKTDHGYSLDSEHIEWLMATMCTFDQLQQRLFVQFLTGSPKLPIGGFRALQPPLTIVRKHVDDSDGGADKFLPSVMTCVNYLKLPQYSSQAILRERLVLAMTEGQGSFHLS